MVAKTMPKFNTHNLCNLHIKKWVTTNKSIYNWTFVYHLYEITIVIFTKLHQYTQHKNRYSSKIQDNSTRITMKNLSLSIMIFSRAIKKGNAWHGYVMLSAYWHSKEKEFNQFYYKLQCLNLLRLSSQV
jgi:hypothetical protein